MGNKTVYVDKVVEKVIEKIIDVNKIKFEQGQSKLKELINDLLKQKRLVDGLCVLSIGEAGSGKSTILRLFYKFQVETIESSADGTRELTKYETKELTCIDSVGFPLTVLNICKALLICLSKGYYPDYLFVPLPTSRASIVSSTIFKIGELLRMQVIPFNPQIYYVMKSINITEVECIRKAINKKIVEELKVIFMNDQNVIISNDEKQPIFKITMKDIFLNTYVRNNKYVEVSYQEHVGEIENDNNIEIFRHYLTCAALIIEKHIIVNGKGDKILMDYDIMKDMKFD